MPTPSSVRPIMRLKGPVDRLKINAPRAVTPIITDWTVRGPNRSIAMPDGSSQSAKASGNAAVSIPSVPLPIAQIGHQIIGNERIYSLKQNRQKVSESEWKKSHHDPEKRNAIAFDFNPCCHAVLASKTAKTSP